MLGPPSIVLDKFNCALGWWRSHRFRPAPPERRSGRSIEFPAEAVGCRRRQGQHSLRRVPERADLEKLKSKGVADRVKLRIEFGDDQRAIHLYLTGRRPARTTMSMHAGTARMVTGGKTRGERTTWRDVRWRQFRTPMPPAQT